MKRIMLAAVAAILVAAGQAQAADTLVDVLGTTTTSPLPAASCIYVDQGSTTDTKACGAAGAYWATLFGLVPLGGDAGTPSAISLLNGTGLPIGAGTTGTLAVNRGGIGTAVAGGTAVDNISGFAFTGMVKRTGAGAYAAAVAKTDFAPATSGSAILAGDGLGGFSNVGIGSGLSFIGGTLSSTAGGGSVTSVNTSGPGGTALGISGGPITGAGSFTFAWSGNSGGIPCYTSTTALGSSALLTANALTLGGGAGVCPSPMGSLGTTTTVLHGNAAGAPTFSAVANADLATMAAHTYKGNNAGSIGAVLDLTATQFTAELNAFVGDSGSGGTKGLVPAPAAGDAAAGKYLSAGGGYSVPAGSGSLTIADTHAFSLGSVTTLNLGAGFIASGSSGAVTVKPTNEITTSAAASYTVQPSDANTTVHLTNASPAVTVQSAATLGNGFGASVQCDNACTLTPASGTINGASSLTLAAHQTGALWTDGSTLSAAVAGSGWSLTDTFTPLANVAALTVNSKWAKVGGTAGAATLDPTCPVGTVNLTDANGTTMGVGDTVKIPVPLTAPRSFAMPPIASYAAGCRVTIVDTARTVSGTNTATITRNADNATLNLGTTFPAISLQGFSITWESDTTNWTAINPYTVPVLQAGQIYYGNASNQTTAGAPTGDVIPNSSNNWTIQNGVVTNPKMASGAAAANLGSAGGDLSGTYPSPTVAKLQGKTVPSAAVSTGDLLIGNAGNWAKNRLTAGTNVTIDDTSIPGAITISSTGGSGTGCIPAGLAGQLLSDSGTGLCTSNAGATYSTGTLSLGTAGSLVGSIALKNATSGTLTLAPPTGALGTPTLTLPAATDTLVGRATTDTLTNKSMAASSITSGTLAKAVGGTAATTGSGAATNLSLVYKTAEDNAQHSFTGSLTETKLASCAFPANSIGATGAVRVTSEISRPASETSSNTLKLRIGTTNDAAGTQVWSQTQTITNLSFWSTSTIHNRTASSQIAHPSQNIGGSPTAIVTTSFDTSANTLYVVLTGQLANTGDHVASEALTCEVLPVGGN